MVQAGRPLIVDCHCHIVVAEMMTAAVPPRWRPPIPSSAVAEFTDVDVMLEQAAAQGVNHLLMSPWIKLVPADPGADLGEAREICRVQNEALSALARSRPVTALAAVPIGDAGAAADCLREAMRLPGVRGAEVPTSVAGTYLADERFSPFWAAAAELDAIVFVHPTTTGLAALDDHYLWNSVGNPIETTVFGAQLVTGKILARTPRPTILIAHGGGALPALRGRLRRASQVRWEARSGDGPDDLLRRLYFDSLTHDREVLASLVAFAGADHVLLGSDRPFDMGSDRPADDIRALGLDPAGEELILGGNAGRLLAIAR
jgi:aminocarboxymuconate-semialdehyde decarboxylase